MDSTDTDIVTGRDMDRAAAKVDDAGVRLIEEHRKRLYPTSPPPVWVVCQECRERFRRQTVFRLQAELGLKTADDTATLDQLICPECLEVGTLEEGD